MAEIIQYLELGNHGFGLTGVYTYMAGRFILDELFSNEEYLKLDHKDSPRFDRDYIFYLDTDELLKITIHEEWAHPYARHEKNAYITVEKTRISACIAHSYKKTSFIGYDLFGSHDNYRMKRHFTLVDGAKYRIKGEDEHFFCKEYKATEYLRTIEGKDIREILKPLNINDIIDRMINKDVSLVLESKPQRERRRKNTNDKK
jgi:hypothetical protein